MERKTYLENEDIKLLFAKDEDRRFIYDLTFEESDVILSMFDDESGFHWEELRDERDVFFNEKPDLDKYLLIEYNSEIVGVFCHNYHNAPIENMEFHIWMRAMKYTGKGIGTRVLRMMIEHINKEYNINTFIMRPWTKNPRAVSAYKKCGFEVKENFELEKYFTKEEIEKYGNGAYVEEETVNMVLNLK